MAADLKDVQVEEAASKDILQNGPGPSVMGDGSATQAPQTDDVEGARPEMETVQPAHDAVLVFWDMTNGTRQGFQQLHLWSYRLHGEKHTSE